jgi:hypothetical protein
MLWISAANSMSTRVAVRCSLPAMEATQSGDDGETIKPSRWKLARQPNLVL